MVCWESWFGSQEIDSTQQKWELTGSWLHIFSPPFWSSIFPSIYRDLGERLESISFTILLGWNPWGINTRNADGSLRSLRIWTAFKVVESGSICNRIGMVPPLTSFSGTSCYDKSLGASNRPALGQGCSWSTIQPASAELPKPKELYP